MFNVNYNTYPTHNSRIKLKLDNNDLVMAWAYDSSSTLHDFNQASASVITECSPGQVVWAESVGNSYLASIGRNNQFSGYLLHSY